MPQDMSDIMNTLNNMIKEDKIPDNIKQLMNNISSENSNSPNNSSPDIDIDTILKMKTIMEKLNNNKDDPRANLLMSLKPYLKDSRKDKVEQYIKLFNISKVMDVFNSTGGEKK